MKLVHTNIVFFRIEPELPRGGSKSSADEFVKRLLNPTSTELAAVKAIHMGSNNVRMVFYNDISFEDTKATLDAIKSVFTSWALQ